MKKSFIKHFRLILFAGIVAMLFSLTLVACSNGGKEQSTHEHTFSDWIVAKEATCTTNGVRGRKCTQCGYYEQETINAVGNHEPYVSLERVEPTCTEAGHTKQVKCRMCDKILEASEEIPALGHNEYGAHDGVAPSCTETGLTDSVYCSRCGELLEDQQVIDALGHDVVVDGHIDPTCETDGATEGSHCSRCGHVFEQQQTINRLGHDYGEWIVDIEPTIDTEGSKHRVCDRCKHIETASIDKHDVSAGYEYDDEHHWEECQDCHEILNYGTHTFGDWVIDKYPSCIEEGQKHKTCNVCGKIVCESIEIVEHTYGSWIVDGSPTCIETGLRHRICGVCGDVDEEIMAFVDHTYGSWIIDKEPTLTKTGSKHKICSVCGHNESETIPQLEYSTITFHLNGGQSPSYVATKRVTSLNANDFFFDVEKDGFNFRGWLCDGVRVFDEDGSIFNNIDLKAEMTFIANWSNRARLRIVQNMQEAGSVTGAGEYAYNQQVGVAAAAYQGYNFVGWYTYEDGLPLSHQREYSYQMWDKDVYLVAYFELAQFSLNIESNNATKGSITINPPTTPGATITYYDQRIESITYKDEVTIAAFTESSARFLGWFDDAGALVTTNAVHKFVMPNYSYHLTAKWDYFTITYNLDGGTNNASNPTYYTLNTPTIYLASPTRSQKEFVGWKLNGEFVTEINTQKAENITLTAVWVNYTFIEYGSYPQALVTDTTINSALNSKAGSLPTASDSKAWTNYGYYDNDQMWYIDLEYGEDKYRGVYFTSSRGYSSDNGYSTSTVYWFRYEPIKWRVLNEEDGVALILADMILDGRAYQDSYEVVDGERYNDSPGVPSGICANNYEYSAIRVWLNDTFYNTAFSTAEKERILTTTVDNSVASTGYSPNQYACKDTKDKVFLLSYKEATNGKFGESNYEDEARDKKVTDYAQSLGTYADKFRQKLVDGEWVCSNAGHWWLRSPNDSYSHGARAVDYFGRIHSTDGAVTDSLGVVPALTIRLS